ncbi:hypothetical protein [Jannaschia donghaensis]|uniref:Uncharacterized protein n=1 Tax=Jannaschia donghaensis TaxID=420998 RepID=A0A0M6YHR8_9RHOB|nr:hypothetical protein [Jannaschia donghaensis]CTQ49225.1 hypothetical protein JDO7802_01237 [Jannaschia donghaensis]
MFRTILAAALTAAFALPTLTAPAIAHEQGYAHSHVRDGNGRAAVAVIGGLAALYLLKRQADKRDDRREERRAAPLRRDRDGRPVWTGRDRRDDRQVRVLPANCYRTFDTRRGPVRGYGARCMQRTVARPGSLPPQCITQIRTDRGTRNLYDARCMRRAGWTSRTARR